MLAKRASLTRQDVVADIRAKNNPTRQPEQLVVQADASGLLCLQYVSLRPLCD
ncbi:MAG: hypothetical protein AAF394_18140 [Planctomycetota bacterium]